jgi:ergothioneine biosynthesis protein EgtB
MELPEEVMIQNGNLRSILQERPDRKNLIEGYRQVRAFSRKLCEPLATEDFVVQSMPDVSPTRWHLAHMTWFFETFVLRDAVPGYKEHNPHYSFLFNSYYNTVGSPFPRALRGLLTRPTVEEVFDYRSNVDRHLLELLERGQPEQLGKILPVVQLGLHHEQQHQELILTDIKHVFAMNPLRPVYREQEEIMPAGSASLEWIPFKGGIHSIGSGDGGFIFDNEAPRHEVCLNDFVLASRPVSNADYLAFMEDGGYERHAFWLADGWATVQQESWKAPLYWEKRGGDWWTMTLSGMRKVALHDPVCHVSYYEADAFASWAGARLPTEAEWEVASQSVPVEGSFVESGRLHPAAAKPEEEKKGLLQMFGTVWEWTRSPYAPYPGYRASSGALGEYNGKFMCSQQVLRGGSVATSGSHVRHTYRNFFYPYQRWQFMGVRLAKDA